MSKTIRIILQIVFLFAAIGFLLWLAFGNKNAPVHGREGNLNASENTGSPDNQSATNSATINQIRKNQKGTLSLVGIKSDGTVVSEKELSFDEAVKLVGSAADVCSGRYNVGSAYVQCTTVRRV